ncbi:MAG: hypothetical protein JNL41_20825 [Phenylobacterium sp.]|uniref:hypothetical protein n=1 Tax=Phenylobacterium sp. TaxID=1871053 RepID=UPI001A3FBB58|nr:hypothetical protein [Phenylobacterium sp.]MBL8556729.1 hypothetical protein [Phenylobacterium sp.]
MLRMFKVKILQRPAATRAADRAPHEKPAPAHPDSPGLRAALLEENYCRAQIAFTEFVLAYP